MKPRTNNFFWCPKRSLSIQINLSQYSCVKRSLVASSSHENLNYKTTTKLHVFKHAINPQKCFIFSYRPQTRSNNIWPIPAERRQCCLLFSLELQNSREWIAFPFECCIKTRLLIFSSHFLKIWMQPREGLSLDFCVCRILLNHQLPLLWLVSILYGKTSVVWLTSIDYHKQS